MHKAAPALSSPLPKQVALLDALLDMPMKGSAGPDEKTFEALDRHGFTLLESDYHPLPRLQQALRHMVTDWKHSGAYRAQLVKKEDAYGCDYVLMLGGSQGRDELMMNVSSVVTAAKLLPPQLEAIEPLYQSARQTIADDMAHMTPQQRKHVRLTLFGHSMGGWLATGLSSGGFDVQLQPQGMDYHVSESVLVTECPGAETLLKTLGYAPEEIADLRERMTEVLIKLGPHKSTYVTGAGGKHVGGTILLIDKSEDVERKGGVNSANDMIRISDHYHSRDILREALAKGEGKGYIVCNPESLYTQHQFPINAKQGLRIAPLVGSEIAKIAGRRLHTRTDPVGLP